VRVLVGTWLVALLLPVWLSLTFSYLFIPAVPWQGVSVDQIQVSPAVPLPRFHAGIPGPSVMSFKPTPWASPAQVQELVAERYREQLSRLEQTQGQAHLSAWDASVDRLNAELADPDALVTPNPLTLLSYTRLIEESAAIGVAAATQDRNRQRAVAAWKLNHALLKLSEDNIDLATYSLDARITTWGMWNLISQEDLEFLLAESDAGALLPGHVNDSLWAQKLRVRWSIRKLALRTDPSQPLPQAGRYEVGLPVEKDIVVRRVLEYYPPLRWAVERNMAAQLSQELDMVEGNRFLVPAYAATTSAQHDPLAFQIQTLRYFEQQVTAKVAGAAARAE
jgi:hypothetical protein